tara:strand:- start:249 stop:557 length:309 start_codon:yes stop_codon:yes gene_type:complete
MPDSFIQAKEPRRKRKTRSDSRVWVEKFGPTMEELILNVQIMNHGTRAKRIILPVEKVAVAFPARRPNMIERTKRVDEQRFIRSKKKSQPTPPTIPQNKRPI